jgi:hypothetical protein
VVSNTLDENPFNAVLNLFDIWWSATKAGIGLVVVNAEVLQRADKTPTAKENFIVLFYFYLNECICQSVSLDCFLILVSSERGERRVPDGER